MSRFGQIDAKPASCSRDEGGRLSAGVTERRLYLAIAEARIRKAVWVSARRPKRIAERSNRLIG